MRRGLILAAFLAFYGTASAGPVTLLCDGSLTLDGKVVPVRGETAILDLEQRTFKPPLYSEYSLIRVSESDVSFGGELPAVSIWGSLDRVSGSLSMNILAPSERKKLQDGGSAKFLAWMTAKCAPAKRMF